MIDMQIYLFVVLVDYRCLEDTVVYRMNQLGNMFQAGMACLNQNL